LGDRGALTGVCRPLLELGSVSEVLQDRSSAVWVERSLSNVGPLQVSFLRCSFDSVPPDSIEAGGALSYRYLLLQSFCPALRLGASRVCKSSWRPSASPGVSFPSAFAEQGARCSRGCLPRHVPLTRFLPSQRFSFPCPPRFISPWNAPGIHPSEPSLPEDGYASRRPSPPAVAATRHPWLGRQSYQSGLTDSVRLGYRGFFPSGVRSQPRRG